MSFGCIQRVLSRSIATHGTKKFVVVEGVEAQDGNDSVPLTELSFEGPNLFRYLARRNNEFFRVEVEIAAD